MCMQALAKLHLQDPKAAALTETLIQAFAPHMQQASTHTHAAMLWAVAVIGVQPPQPWWRRWAQASMGKLPACSLHDLSMLAWAMVKLGQRPPDAWARRMLQVVAQWVNTQPSQHSYTPQSQRSSSVTSPTHPHAQHSMDASSRLKGAGNNSNSILAPGTPHRPHGASEHGHQDDVLLTMKQGASDLRCLAVVLWSLAKLRVQPEPELLDVCLDRAGHLMQVLCDSHPDSHALLPTSPSQSVAMLTHAVAAFQHRPSRTFMQAFFTTTTSWVRTAKPQELMILLMAVCNWQVRPPHTWMEEIIQASAARMDDFTPQGLVVTLDAMAQLSYLPPPAWMHAYTATLHRYMHQLTPSASAQLLACMAAIGYQPPPAMLAALTADVQRHAHAIPSKRWFPAVLGVHVMHAERTLWQQQASALVRSDLSRVQPSTDPISAVSGTGFVQSSNAMQSWKERSMQRPQLPSQVHAAAHGPVARSDTLAEMLVSARSKLAYCSVANVAHLTWAMVLQTQTFGDGNQHPAGAATLQRDIPTPFHAVADVKVVQGSSVAAEAPRASRVGRKGGAVVPDSYVPNVLAVLRQRACTAAPADVASLLQALAALLAPHRYPTSQGALGRAVVYTGDSIGGGGCLDVTLHGGLGVLTDQQLVVVLEACVGGLQAYSMSELAHTIQAITALGGVCQVCHEDPGEGVMQGIFRRAQKRSAGLFEVVGGVDAVQHGKGVLQGVSLDVWVLMRELAMRCLQLLLEGQQAATAAAQRRGAHAGVGRQPVSRLRGTRGVLLDRAYELVAGSHVLGPVGVQGQDVLFVWRVLLECGFVHSLGRAECHQVCQALYHAVEQADMQVQDQKGWRDVAAGLAERMPLPPSDHWLGGEDRGVSVLRRELPSSSAMDSAVLGCAK